MIRDGKNLQIAGLLLTLACEDSAKTTDALEKGLSAHGEKSTSAQSLDDDWYEGYQKAIETLLHLNSDGLEVIRLYYLEAAHQDIPPWLLNRLYEAIFLALRSDPTATPVQKRQDYELAIVNASALLAPALLRSAGTAFSNFGNLLMRRLQADYDLVPETAPAIGQKEYNWHLARLSKQATGIISFDNSNEDYCAPYEFIESRGQAFLRQISTTGSEHWGEQAQVVLDFPDNHWEPLVFFEWADASPTGSEFCAAISHIAACATAKGAESIDIIGTFPPEVLQLADLNLWIPHEQSLADYAHRWTIPTAPFSCIPDLQLLREGVLPSVAYRISSP